MCLIKLKIKGVPYAQNKSQGNREACKKWSLDVIEQTKNELKVKDACNLKVTFLLPPDKYPADLPYGSDLDNLLKRFMDALEKTIFSEVQGGDSCVISINAIKTKVNSYEDAGALLEVLP